MNITDHLPDRQLFHVPHFRTWRRVIGLEQREVAALSGEYQSHISYIETTPGRRIHGRRANRLADALGIPAELLVLPSLTDPRVGEYAAQAAARAARRRVEHYAGHSDGGNGNEAA